jgi:hypothetical protein
MSYVSIRLSPWTANSTTPRRRDAWSCRTASLPMAGYATLKKLALAIACLGLNIIRFIMLIYLFYVIFLLIYTILVTKILK